MSATTVHEYAAALRRLALDGSTEHDLLAAVDRIATTLLQAGRRSDMRRLLRLMEGITDAGMPVTEVTTAAPLSPSVQARFGAHVRVVTDRSLVAGTRVLAGDRLIRSTIRDRLDALLSTAVLS